MLKLKHAWQPWMQQRTRVCRALFLRAICRFCTSGEGRSTEYYQAPDGVIFREAKFIMATHFNSVNVLYAPL